jgi:hypothetical protein
MRETLGLVRKLPPGRRHRGRIAQGDCAAPGCAGRWRDLSAFLVPKRIANTVSVSATQVRALGVK